jgi:cobalt/nickel transport system ATP-binding protein
LSQGQIVYNGPTEQAMGDPEFLLDHALESPLSYSRPYCQLDHAPLRMGSLMASGTGNL